MLGLKLNHVSKRGPWRDKQQLASTAMHYSTDNINGVCLFAEYNSVMK